MLLKIVSFLRNLESRQLFSSCLSSISPTAASCMLLKFRTCFDVARVKKIIKTDHNSMLAKLEL